MDDHAIPRIVTTLIAHPDAVHVQANTINNKGTRYFNYRSGALLPFLPDPAYMKNNNESDDLAAGSKSYGNVTDLDWRTSSLPYYTTSDSIDSPPFDIAKIPWSESVSYTHLTLPTKRIV